MQFDSYDPKALRSHVEYRSDLLQPSLVGGKPGNPLTHLPLTDYFGAVTVLQPGDEAYPLQASKSGDAEAVEEEQLERPRRPPPSLTSNLHAPTIHASPEFRLIAAAGGVAIVALLLADLLFGAPKDPKTKLQ